MDDVSLRVAAISFLNPAPLLYDFEHEPAAERLRAYYDVKYTLPSACATQLVEGSADLGLIPVAALTSEMAVVPGCTIASQRQVRSILLLVKNPLHLAIEDALRGVRSVAMDAASRSSVAYVRVLLEHFLRTSSAFAEQSADAVAMLREHDAALLIGDPALLARERKDAIAAAVAEPLLWLDVAELWRERTGLPWVAAVWAVRPEALGGDNVTAQQLVLDLNASREHGCANVEQLVTEWTPKLALPAATIRTYLTSNIHYALDAECVEAIGLFRTLAAGVGALPGLRELRTLN